MRPSYTVTATSVAGSKVVTVTAGNMSSIAAGMKAYGTNLEVDGEDLNKNTRVSGVDQANHTITLDRPCAISGSFSLLCYVKNALILIPEPFYNPTYDSSKEYRAPTIDGVQMTQAGGDGIMVRPGRDQFHLTTSSKVVNCYGRGVSLVGSNDSQIDCKVGIGGHWEEALLIAASSTPRVMGIDCWDTQLVDKCYDLVIRGCRQAHVIAGDLNGRMYIKGKAGETNGLVRVSGLNWKWHTGDSFPDGTSDQFLFVDGATVVLDTPYFYGDRTDNNAPNYLAKVDGGGLLTIAGGRILTDPVDVARPYKVGLFNVTSGNVRGWYIDHTGAMVRMGDVAGVADGSNAATGAVGEEINMKVASSSAVSLTTNGITNLGSLSLTAGDWDQCATAHFICAGATITGLHLGMPGNTNTIPIAPQQSAYMNVPVTGFTGTLSVVLPPFRNSLSTTSTERTNVRAVFSAGTVSAYGSSRARRVR